MGTTVRTEDSRLESSPLALVLEAEPWRFEFYQAVRLMKIFAPEKTPVGRFGTPGQEVVHFGAHASTVFPASQIQNLSIPSAGPAQMTVNFFGLTGPLGCLPLCYTELVMDRVREGDRAMRDFLDIFNHRAISLLYRAWEKYRFPAAYDRDGTDHVSGHLLELIGLGTPGLQKRQTVRDDALVFYAGLFSLQPRSAAALAQILTDYFELPVEVEQFVGAWYKIDTDEQCCLGDRKSSSEQVGLGAVIGDEIFDRSSRIRIRLGPLTYEQYRSFLPGGKARKVLDHIVRFFTDDAVDTDLQLVLQRNDVPGCDLGATDEKAPRLGWSTWIKSAPFSRDPGEAVMQLS